MGTPSWPKVDKGAHTHNSEVRQKRSAQGGRVLRYSKSRLMTSMKMLMHPIKTGVRWTDSGYQRPGWEASVCQVVKTVQTSDAGFVF